MAAASGGSNVPALELLRLMMGASYKDDLVDFIGLVVSVDSVSI